MQNSLNKRYKRHKFLCLSLFLFLFVILLSNFILSTPNNLNENNSDSLNNSLSINFTLNYSFNNTFIQKEVYFFWGIGCPHCENVINSGVLEKVQNISGVLLYKLEVYNNQSNRDLYSQLADELKISQYDRGVPLLIVKCNNSSFYFVGDQSIINNLEKTIKECKHLNDFNSTNENNASNLFNNQKLTLSTIIVAALIDSINPCAFGVLLFLLTTLISIASRKRALKYGLIYSFIVFIVYLAVGLGIISIISKFSAFLNLIILMISILIFFGGLIEIKDFFFYGKGFSLKIPVKVKPLLEKITKKGTLLAVVLLGIIVSLVELPCTGGIYLAILSLMHLNKTFGIPYLLIYNLIYISPLIIIVLLSYFGTKIEKIQNWIELNKKIMRLVAGIIMIFLSLYLLNSLYHYI